MDGNTAYPTLLDLTLKDKLSKSYQKKFQLPGLNTKISAPRDSSILEILPWAWGLEQVLKNLIEVGISDSKIDFGFLGLKMVECW